VRRWCLPNAQLPVHESVSLSLSLSPRHDTVCLLVSTPQQYRSRIDEIPDTITPAAPSAQPRRLVISTRLSWQRHRLSAAAAESGSLGVNWCRRALPDRQRPSPEHGSTDTRARPGAAADHCLPTPRYFQTRVRSNFVDAVIRLMLWYCQRLYKENTYYRLLHVSDE